MKTLVKTTWISWYENEKFNSIVTYSSKIAKAILDELIKQELNFSIEYRNEQIDVPFDED